MNRVIRKEKPDQVLLPTTEIRGYVSIANKLRSDTASQTNTTIQQTLFHIKKVTGLGHSDWNHFPIGSLNSGIDVPRPGRNIDKQPRMYPQGPIVTTIPDSNIDK